MRDKLLQNCRGDYDRKRKMLAGELYDCGDEKPLTQWHKAKDLLTLGRILRTTGLFYYHLRNKENAKKVQRKRKENIFRGCIRLSDLV